MGKQSWKPGNMLNPVPAVMVSVADEEHRPNIITVAWAGTICTNPPMVSISVRPSRYSYDIIEKTGEFVINLTTEKLARACDYCGVVSGRDVDKFAKTGLTPMPVEHVSAPAIAESPVNIACRVTESRALGSHTMFIAEVVGVTVDDEYLDENDRFHINDANLIMYSHGEYFALGKYLGKFGYSVQKKKSGRNNIKKLLLDAASTSSNGAISVIRSDAEIIPAGTTVYSMPIEDKHAEYQTFADCYDVHFIFDDMVPNIDFYAVPRVDIMAVDSYGGYIGTVGGLTDMESEFPICYIDESMKVFLISDNFKRFAADCANWRKHLEPYNDVTLFSSKDEAAKEYEFLDIDMLLHK